MSRLVSAMSIEGHDGSQVPLMLPGYRKVTETDGFQSVKAKSSVRPAVGRHGAISATRYRDERLYTVNGLVVDQTENDPDRVWQEWDAIQSALSASIDTDRLLQWSAGGRDLQATVRLEDLSNPVQVGPNMLAYQAQLRNPPGIAFSQQEETLTADPPAASGGGGMEMPATMPVLFVPASGGSVSVLNEGGLPTPPLIILHGFLRSPIVECGDRRLVIDGDIAPGDALWLNTQDRSVLLNGDPLVDRRPMLRSASSRWFEIPPKTPTIVNLYSSDFDAQAGIEVRFRHAY